MNEDLRQIKEDLKFIKKALKYQLFNTVYNSFLIFVIGLIINIVLNRGINSFSSGLANGAVIFFGILFIISFVVQLLSIFNPKLKRWSVYIIFYSIISALISLNDKLLLPVWLTVLIILILGIVGHVALKIYFDRLEEE